MSKMNRRTFLKLLGSAGAVTALGRAIPALAQPAVCDVCGMEIDPDKLGHVCAGRKLWNLPWEKTAQVVVHDNRSLGRMLLQTFDAWTEMNNVPGDDALQMRLDIAEEYGIVKTPRQSSHIVDNLGLIVPSNRILTDVGGNVLTDEVGNVLVSGLPTHRLYLPHIRGEDGGKT